MLKQICIHVKLNKTLISNNVHQKSANIRSYINKVFKVIKAAPRLTKQTGPALLHLCIAFPQWCDPRWVAFTDWKLLVGLQQDGANTCLWSRESDGANYLFHNIFCSIPDVLDCMDHFQAQIDTVFCVLPRWFWNTTDAIITIAQEFYSKHVIFLKKHNQTVD